MPELSRFLGIVIRMHYRDHAPPHFHAKYGEILSRWYEENAMHIVREAECLPDYRLRLVFEDGSVREADVGPYLDGEIFEPLRAPDYFRTGRVNEDLDTVGWGNGADFSPDFLYEIAVEVAGRKSVG